MIEDGLEILKPAKPTTRRPHGKQKVRRAERTMPKNNSRGTGYFGVESPTLSHVNPLAEAQVRGAAV
jgi:hypothetical protein